METNKKQLFKKAIDKFGIKTQRGMLMEECAELIRATNKLNRDEEVLTDEKVMTKHALNFVEEIADVEIMIEQMVVFYNLRKMIDIKKQEKLERLEMLLSKL